MNLLTNSDIIIIQGTKTCSDYPVLPEIGESREFAVTL